MLFVVWINNSDFGFATGPDPASAEALAEPELSAALDWPVAAVEGAPPEETGAQAVNAKGPTRSNVRALFLKTDFTGSFDRNNSYLNGDDSIDN
ncbi:hypothetical protein UM93_14920 [Psychromicrobium lacuslunae]|uniref:Uncharacterized protein n=1 Tax=Psychromicrobium lacuslunae TaxID=1618207 RepID=A0A0D4C1M3_9MICC|nr:hypothetical protein UM93_14920 [Psychromicrobium lacuslunae]